METVKWGLIVGDNSVTPDYARTADVLSDLIAPILGARLVNKAVTLWAKEGHHAWYPVGQLPLALPAGGFVASASVTGALRRDMRDAPDPERLRLVLYGEEKTNDR